MTYATKKMKNIQASLQGAENILKIKNFLDLQIDDLKEFIESLGMMQGDMITPQP